MKAVCYACGREKSEPLVVCEHCEVKPLSVKDKTSSICLSNMCLDEASLQKGSRFLREKRKLPKFGERLIKKATEIVESLESDASQYTLMDVDDSFFDFDGFGDGKGETIKVHAIGRPADDGEPHSTGSNLGNSKNTYEVLEWEIGKDISIEDADTHVDEFGELYIHYTWLGDKGWVWKHVSRSHFEDLKTLESMRE